MEEERQRAKAQQAQTQAMKSQLGTMAGGAAPLQSAPKQAVESPMLDNEPFINADTQNMFSDFINSLNSKDIESILPGRKKRKKEPEMPDDGPGRPLPPNDGGEDTSSDEVETQTDEGEVVEEESNEQGMDSYRSQPVGDLQDLGEGLIDEELAQIGQEINNLYKDAVKNAPQVLKGGVEKEVEKPNFLERIKNKVNEFRKIRCLFRFLCKCKIYYLLHGLYIMI